MINKYRVRYFFLCSGRLAENDKIVEMKQTVLDQQDEVIKLMRNINLQKTANGGGQDNIQRTIDGIFNKYEDAKQYMKNSEVNHIDINNDIGTGGFRKRLV